MPEPKQKQSARPATAERKRSTALNVMVNPEDTIGIPIEPAFISLGVKATSFKKEVGGTNTSA